MMMTWDKLLSAERLGAQDYRPQRNRSIFVQDHDRIVFSAPFRRLANKTQVQPLYENDHIHHRLIHSIEVSSVGRSLAMGIGQWLVDHHELDRDHLHDLVDVVQAACVAHDIGNPPFGHSGEEAMGAWFAEHFDRGQGLFAELDPQLHSEFTAFEGNAQGFRILTRLEMYRHAGGMQLSKATLGAFAKYPVTAHERLKLLPELTGQKPAGLKKFGLFQSDAATFDQVAEGTGLLRVTAGEHSYWARHPLVFVMEAADDITYTIVDLEDAFTTGELPFEMVRDLLIRVVGTDQPVPAGMTASEEIALLRARGIGRGIEACIQAFCDHHTAILEGRMAKDLITASALGPIFAEMKRLAQERIFTAPRKTELEISGRRIIANVLTGILPVYQDLARVGWDVTRVGRRGEQILQALSLELRDVWDAHSALHAMADFTSGMTDRYALRISRMFSGI